MADAQFVTDTRSSVIETNKVLRNTYMLLSMTLAFSALTAGLSMAFNLPHPGLLITMVAYFGLLFATMKFRNSGLGIVCVFALTGFMGLTMGPIISAYLTLSNGAQIVSYAFGTTAVVFLGLSGYAIASKKDFSFLGPMLMVGILVAFCAAIASWFLSIPGLSLAVSSMFVLLMAGMMLYETSNIVNGGETNYIMATVSLYVSLYNMFMSLLHIFGALGGEE
ncbi:MAG: Bax inhibitor-1/YccA family protein [Pseudomonadales bacterium]